MGAAGRGIAGILLIGAGAVFGAVTMNWSLAAAVMIEGASLLYSAIPVGVSSNQNGILKMKVDAKQGLPVVYGFARVGASLVDVRVDTASRSHSRLVMVAAFCHGSQNGLGIDSIEEIKLNGQSAWQPVSPYQISPFNKAVGGDLFQNEVLAVGAHLGTSSQVLDTSLNGIFPGVWPSTSAGAGIAYAVLLLWFDNTVYGTGLPQITANISGVKLYDPRTTNTVWSDNPALAIWDYLTSTVYGFGIDPSLLDTASFISAADYCDELITPYSGATPQKRFEINGVLDTNRDLQTNLNLLLSSCRGSVLNSGGVWKLIIRREQSYSGIEINVDNTVEGTWKYTLPGSGTVLNRLTANYVSALFNYAADSVDWPDPNGTNPYLDEDGGYESNGQIDLPFTVNSLMAQQIAMVTLRESRESIVVTVTGKEELLQLEYGDIAVVTQPSPGWIQKPFWVIGTNYRPLQHVVDLLLVEYQPTTYELDVQFPAPTIPDTSLPDVTTVAPPTSLVLHAGDADAIVSGEITVVRIKATWVASADPFLDHYEIQARPSASGNDWDSYGTAMLDATLFFIAPVNLFSWDVRIRAINTLGIASAWVSSSITPSVSVFIPTIEILATEASFSGSDLVIDADIVIRDRSSVGSGAGTLYVWVNKSSYSSPDSSAAPDGHALITPLASGDPTTVDHTTVFTLTGGGTDALLSAIKGPAGPIGKVIYARFITVDGRDSGIIILAVAAAGCIIPPVFDQGGTIVSQRPIWIKDGESILVGEPGSPAANAKEVSIPYTALSIVDTGGTFFPYRKSNYAFIEGTGAQYREQVSLSLAPDAVITSLDVRALASVIGSSLTATAILYRQDDSGGARTVLATITFPTNDTSFSWSTFNVALSETVLVGHSYTLEVNALVPAGASAVSLAFAFQRAKLTLEFDDYALPLLAA